MEDAVLAQLLGMGFESEDIEACLTELSSQGSYSLQAATEWLLQHQQQSLTGQSSSPRLVLSTPHPDVSMETKPLSSTSDLSTSPHDQPLKSRHMLSDEHSRDKERFVAKEREEAVKKARMGRMADIKARQQVKQQIEEDRKAKQERLMSPTTPTPTLQDAPHPSPQSADSHVTKSPDSCRVQVRLPDGGVVRHTFPPSATLGSVVEVVRERAPHLSHILLVQPFPHHEFTEEEYQSTLHSLNLCPSASLVAKQQSADSSSPSKRPHPLPHLSQPSASHEGLTHSIETDASTDSLPNPQRVIANYERMLGNRVQRLEGRGYRLGDGTAKDDELMDTGGDEEEEEEMDEDDDDDVVPVNNNFGRPRPHLPPLPNIPGLQGPPPLGRPHPLARRAHRVVPGVFMGLGGGDEDGHRLGGKESVNVGDLQQQALRMREAARSAAIKRSIAHTSPTSNKPHTLTDHGPPTLELLCIRTLLFLSRFYGLPSCSGVTPLIAQKLIKALKSEKRLNPKTLAAFHGCPLQVLELDNYIYTTNELLQALCFFPTLTHLSLGSCSIITDRALSSLLPYLPGLTLLSLSGCRQLVDQVIARAIGRCTLLEVLRLAEVKVTDKGISLLLTTPLTKLRELDLSRTQITANSLAMLPAGTPNLESLNIEGTHVDQFSVLSQLPHLHTLNSAHCPQYSDVGSLDGCRGLHSLSLVGLCVETAALEQLATAGLRLSSLRLPDRNTFFDDGLQAVSAFPLSSLNLMDYCHVTDEGISHVGHMTTLQSLTLSRTKLTDQGMPYLTGLTDLRELNIDNTLVTDAGMGCVSSLIRLDVLSLSDTKVTSQFILDGTLDPLGMLTKLNISRTAVCDRGVCRLRLPSLIMLNVNWTCVTEQSSLERLRESGCPLLEVLGNSNIGQPLPGQRVTEDKDQ